MRFFKKHPLAIFVAACGLVAAFFSAPVAQISQTLTNPLLIGWMRLGNNSAVAPSSSGQAYLGTTDRRFHYVVSDTTDFVRVKSDQYQIGSTIGGPDGSIRMKFVNASGASIAKGNALVYDATGVAMMAVTAKGATAATVADSLFRFTDAKFAVTFVAVGTAAATDTIVVRGIKDGASVATLDSLVLTAGAGSTTWWQKSTGRTYWTRIDSISLARVDDADSVSAKAYPYAGVRQSASAGTTFAGVAAETIPDGSAGWGVIYGPVDAVVNAATAAGAPGMILETAASGRFVTDAAATTGTGVGRLMEYTNKDAITARIFVTAF